MVDKSGPKQAQCGVGIWFGVGVWGSPDVNLRVREDVVHGHVGMEISEAHADPEICPPPVKTFMDYRTIRNMFMFDLGDMVFPNH